MTGLLAAAAFRHWLDRWAPLAEWAVATGTLLLAIATFVLARRARQEAGAVAHQVEVERDQLIAARRPLVLPMAGLDGGTVHPNAQILFKNAGAGPAMNVRGFLWWRDSAGGASSLTPLTIATGDEASAVVLGEGSKPNWENASGFVRYHDLSGLEWQTHYRFRVDGFGNRRVEVVAVGLTSELGEEPGYNGDVGWVNKPEGLKLWLDP